MTLNEFKAWLEGYEHSFRNVTPNAEEWAMIKEKLYGVNGVSIPTTNPLYPVGRPGLTYNPNDVAC